MTTWDSLMPVVYVVVGALIGYLGNAAIERRRRRYQKLDELASAKRLAIERTLACMDPIQNALSSISLLVSSYLTHLSMENEEFLRHYNAHIPEPEKLDIPLAQRRLLPAGIHEEGLRILVELEMEIRTEAVQWAQEARLQNHRGLGLFEMRKRIGSLQKRVDSLRDRLASAYQETFLG